MGIFIKQNLLKLTHQSSLKTFLVLITLVSLAVGQTSSTKECKETKAKKENSSTSWKNKTRSKNVLRIRTRTRSSGQNVFQRARTVKAGSIEKSISVHSEKVFVQVCVTQGKVKINGWKRNEVRAFVQNSKELGIRVRERSRKDKKPVWLDIVGYNSYPGTERRSRARGTFSKCLSGDIIELDVPQYADVKLNVRSGDAVIDEINSAKLTVINGDIDVNNIKRKTDAHTHQGSITVRNSGGRMSATTTTGNIIAYNTESNEIGDYFKAKTRSGSVTLQSIGQKEVEASSVSGTLNYIGEIKDYGQYGFSTTNGLINMIIPANSSFRLSATYGGSFRSELSLADLIKTRTSSIVSLSGKVGDGEANVYLRSYNGAIRIRKQNVRLAQLLR